MMRITWEVFLFFKHSMLFPDFIIASPKLEFQPIIGFDEV